MDSLGDRMKSYEDNTRLEKGVVCIRVDGKGFHTWTRSAKLDRPFDLQLHSAMHFAMLNSAEQMQGFRMAYTQSDECSFVIANPEEMSGGWFDYKLQKLVSITASAFTYYFNDYMRLLNRRDYTPPAFFDARAFSVPIEDAANVFVWRQLDNKRNYVQAYAQSIFAHKEIQGVSNADLINKLWQNGFDPLTLPSWVQHGTVLTRYREILEEKLFYEDFNALMGFEELIDAAN